MRSPSAHGKGGTRLSILTAVPSSTFEDAVAFTIDVLEGGGQIVRDDGGVTRWGIAQKYHPDVDVELLTRQGAIAIYRAEYWDHLRCDDLPPWVRDVVFDMGVNPGQGHAVDMLQEELRVERDGVIGPDTLAAARRAAPMRLVEGLTARRILYYFGQTMTYPYKLQWINGWIRRSIKVAMRVSSC